MEFSEVVRRRRMVRNYDPDRPVPAEVRDRILANALRAPSAGFTQGWAFLVLESASDRDRFWAATSPESPTGWLPRMRRAPLIVVSLSHRDAYLDRYAEADKGWTDRDEARWPVPYWHIDTGFASLTMLLTVVDEGLGSCFFGIQPDRFDSFRQEFGVPDAYTPIGALTIGYRESDPMSPSLRRGHRPAEEVLHFGSW
ncbi:MAG: nitroreductase family protein [Actinocatenispora sp.]